MWPRLFVPLAEPNSMPARLHGGRVNNTRYLMEQFLHRKETEYGQKN